jgi:hypothetical protein
MCAGLVCRVVTPAAHHAAPRGWSVFLDFYNRAWRAGKVLRIAALIASPAGEGGWGEKQQPLQDEMGHTPLVGFTCATVQPRRFIWCSSSSFHAFPPSRDFSPRQTNDSGLISLNDQRMG